jgi:hypothetical protein
MTHPGFIVTLADDLDTETALSVCELLRQIRGVVDVVPVQADTTITRMARLQADDEWRRRISALLATR